MTEETAVGSHYARGDLFDAIQAAMTAAGIDPAAPSPEDLAPLEHFHTRGLTATRDLTERLGLGPDRHVLDIGCGIGGPARFMARQYGCRVTGIDLTAEFCDVARKLTALLGLSDRVDIRQGDACALPFEAASFDAAMSQNVAMNIVDKAPFYGEAFRVLKPGGLLATSEMTLGEGETLYPVPWSSDGSGSYLQTADETRAAMEAAGFEVVACDDRTEETVAFNKAMAERIARDGPPALGRQILMGAQAKEKAANSARNIEDGRVRPCDFLCRKPTG